MHSDRKAAITVGVLFIIGDIAGGLSLLVTRGLLEGPDALTKIAANQNQLVRGSPLVLVTGQAPRDGTTGGPSDGSRRDR